MNFNIFVLIKCAFVGQKNFDIYRNARYYNNKNHWSVQSQQNQSKSGHGILSLNGTMDCAETLSKYYHPVTCISICTLVIYSIYK
jgi:hypothetical protein